MELKGWRRKNGEVGIRNHVVVIPSVACANHAVSAICRRTGAIPVLHNQGTCGEFGKDREQTVRTLVGIGSHPNVAWALVVGLGCEETDAHKLADKIRENGGECESLLIQEIGEKEVIRRGVVLVRKAMKSAERMRRERISLKELVVGVKCGASDFSSALFSNPAVGMVSDFIIEEGGTVIFGERLEVVGAEHIIARRTKNKDVRRDFLRRIRNAIDSALKAGVDWVGSQPSLGNIKGGLTTIEEKSLGAIKKVGTHGLAGCLDYAEKPKKKGGLYFMDTPGYDVECVSGLAAGGCHLTLFTTGRGTYLGSPVLPVVKVCANPSTCKKLRDAIDVDLSFLLRKNDMMRAKEKIISFMVKVINGKLTKAERGKHFEFAIERIGPSA